MLYFLIWFHGWINITIIRFINVIIRELQSICNIFLRVKERGDDENSFVSIFTIIKHQLSKIFIESLYKK